MRETKFKNHADLPLTLTAPEVGEVLGISRAAAYQLVRSDGFPSFKIGTRILCQGTNSLLGSTDRRRIAYEKIYRSRS